MTLSWDEEMQALRGEFLREAAERLISLRRLLALLGREAPDAESLLELRRGFHAFAGSGTTYGFPHVSDVGLQGERICVAALDASHGLSESSLSALGAAVESLGHDLAAPAARSDGVDPSRDKPVPRPAQVLVVDPDPQVRESVARELASAGFAPLAAASQAEALRALDAERPDALITGVRLAEGPGYALVERVRGMPRCASLPILVVSPIAAFLDKVEALHCGADGCFAEPVDWDALVGRLRHLLRRDVWAPGRVLYVEDDPNQAAYARMVLQSGGYEVRICADPRRFEAELELAEPDLILMDVVLPGASGYDLVRYIRQDEKHALLPVVLLTTLGELDARIEGTRAGSDDHLVKPVPPGLLLSTAASRVERSRLLKSLLVRDGLTRLLTHSVFLERARAFTAGAGRPVTKTVAWVLLDLDHFKSINECHGYAAGDRVLVSLAGLLLRRLREADTLARYGGEQFAVLIEDMAEGEVLRLVTRLLQEFRALDQKAADRTFHASFSAGVALLDSEMGLEEWRQAALGALQAAKAAGRGRVLAAPATTA